MSETHLNTIALCVELLKTLPDSNPPDKVAADLKNAWAEIATIDPKDIIAASVVVQVRDGDTHRLVVGLSGKSINLSVLQLIAQLAFLDSKSEKAEQDLHPPASVEPIIDLLESLKKTSLH